MNILNYTDEPVIIDKITESAKTVYENYNKHLLENIKSDIKLLHEDIIEETKFMTTRFQRPEQVNKKRNKNRRKNKHSRKQRKRNRK
ncbi:hypothetical protein HYO65_gp265 [Tenacibaculum phage PTm1]|uniref:Uncharacterized protein n=2 Tax=Shirahamavirus PTm1 TaxID=2846435 RepID=A0A5S9BZ83_9CAUD|nr:hypothetical protein HYO65_gp265 [Tenacibaculum phage PTm1]BBI90657.1 hypothetical protein [Tenacibaculum phage PTm1]BBI90962.1 hypothetical protein [Tenacibaculum phage PTm5]